MSENTFLEHRIPSGVYSALTKEQFEATAYDYGGVKLVGSEEGEYAWAYGHIDPVAMAKAGDALAREEWGVPDHEDFDPELSVRHIWAVRTSPSADEWTISWAERYHNHGERFPLTLLDTEGIA